MKYSSMPVTEYSEPAFIADVYACFELNGIDAPILRGVKSYARAMNWRNADRLNRYFVLFALDA